MQIVALHGFLGHTRDWEPCGLPNILPIDLYDSRFAKPSQGFEAWAQSFNAYIRSLPNCDRVILGYSLGGRLALYSIQQDPTLWKSAIFISTHPGLQDPTQKAQRLKSDAVWANRFFNEPWEPLIAAWNAQPVFKNSVQPRRPEIAFNRNQLAETLTHWSLGHQNFFSAPSIPHIWAVGEHDTKFQQIAPAKPHIIPNAGHRIPYDAPFSIKDLIRFYT